MQSRHRLTFMRRMQGRCTLPVILLLGFCGLPAPTFAADKMKVVLEFAPDLESGRRTYDICARCHLPEAWGNADGTYPQLAGQHVNVLMKQVLDIRNGFRSNPAMRPFVQRRTVGGYQELADVVSYISTLPMTPGYTQGPWSRGSPQYEEGRRLYGQYCVGCHGEHGEGDNATAHPRLQGQHYPYMRRQAIRVRQGLRQVDPAMAAIFASLTPAQIDRALNYVSQQPVPKEDLAPSVDWRNPDFQ